jgi:hypothetical protein
VLGSSSAGDNAEPLWTQVFNGAYLTFDGSNDNASVADAPDLRIAGSYTIEAWVRRAKLNATQASSTRMPAIRSATTA